MNEQIEMYRAVQKYRGKWREDDPCWHKVFGLGRVSRIDGVGFGGFNTIRAVFGKKEAQLLTDDPDLLWLPPTAPRLGEDDGRNLWDMVDWDMVKPYIHFDGTVTLYRVGLGDQLIVRNAPLPDALLRAIAGKGERR